MCEMQMTPVYIGLFLVFRFYSNRGHPKTLLQVLLALSIPEHPPFAAENVLLGTGRSKFPVSSAPLLGAPISS